MWLRRLFCALSVPALLVAAGCSSRPRAVAPTEPHFDAAPPPSPTTRATDVDAGPSVTTAVAADTDAGLPPPVRLRLRGVNMSGAEFTGDGTRVPGAYGKDYIYPSAALVDHFVGRGFNFFRLPFRHERLQPNLRGPLNEDEVARMKGFVDHATKLGATVLLVPHNSFRHGIGCDVLAPADARCHFVSEYEIGDVMGRLGARFKDNARVQIGTTNEPHHMPGGTSQVVALNNAAIRELRRVGFTGTIVTPGDGWSGAMNWNATWYGDPNTKAMLAVSVDDAVSFDAHLYFDKDGSGKGDCVSPSIGVERLAIYTTWLRKNGRTGIVGELGAIDTPTCRAAVTNALAFLERNHDVIVGWSAWNAGEWSASTSSLSLGGGLKADRPQMSWFTPFLPCAR